MRYAIVPVTAFQQNCSVIWCPETNAGAVVDPGGDVDRILKVVDQYRVRLEKILLTHGHIDHAGGVAELVARLSLPVEGPERQDGFWIDNLPEQSRMFGVAVKAAFVPDRWLVDGDTVELGNLRLQVVHCPGHTPGHVVFYHQPSRLALVGDVLFQGSIGRTDFPRGSYPALIDSIRNRLFPLGDEVSFIPGHGPMSTFGAERRSNPFLID